MSVASSDLREERCVRAGACDARLVVDAVARFSGILTMLACCTGGAAGMESNERIRTERLDNGLRIVVMEEPGAPLLSVQLWFATGSGADNPERPGVAVLARRALHDRGDLAARLRAAGALCTSRTTYDTTSFAITCRDEQLAAALDAHYERLSRGAFEREEFERAVAGEKSATERGKLVDFAGVGRGESAEPGWIRSERIGALRGVLFPGQPYAADAELVSASAMKDASAAELTLFADRWFVSGNATLFVIGDVAAAASLEHVRSRFAALPWKEPPARPQYPSADVDEIRRETESSSTGVDFGWCVMPWGYAENAVLDVLTRVLMDPFEGPLRQRLRELKLAMPRFRREAWRDDGLLAACFDAPRSAQAAIEAAVHESLKRMAEAGPTAGQLNRARRDVLREIDVGREDFVQRAERMAAQEMIGGDGMLEGFEPSVVAHVTRGAMQRAAGMLLERRRAVVTRGSTGPEANAMDSVRSGDEWLDGSAALARLSVLRTAATGAAPVDAGVPASRVVDGRDPTTRSIATGPLSSREERVRVRMLATARVSGHSATVLETLLLAGTETHPGELLSDYLTYHAIDVRVIASARYGTAAWIVEAPPGERDRTMGVMEEIARRPSVDEGAFIEAVRRRSEWVRALANQPREMGDFLARHAWDQRDPTEIPTVEALRKAAIALRANSHVDMVELRERASGGAETPTVHSVPAGDAQTASTTRKASGRVLWWPSESESIELRCVVPMEVLADRFRDDPHQAAWLMGAAHEAGVEIDGVARWRWRSRIDIGSLVVATCATEQEATRVLMALQRRIADLAGDRIPDEEGEIAAALAETTRGLSEAGQQAERFLARSGSLGVGATSDRKKGVIVYVVVGGGERLAEDLSKLGEVRRVGDGRR